MEVCSCGAPATRPVKVSTIPGSGDGRIVTISVCPRCYERDGWADIDLTGSPWELTLQAR